MSPSLPRPPPPQCKVGRGDLSDAANARPQCIGINIAKMGGEGADMVVFLSDPGIKSPMRENIHTTDIPVSIGASKRFILVS